MFFAQKFSVNNTALKILQEETVVRTRRGSTHENDPVAGVFSTLNSATVMPRIASCGANIAAGYTTDDVPTYQ